MTPTRAKRNSRVPERFSSDSHRIELSSSQGETILNYTDNTTSTTHKLTPMNTKIRLKPIVREPLKVKLPKLKRQHHLEQSQTKHQKGVPKINKTEVRVHKIKLPSSSSRKIKSKSQDNNVITNSELDSRGKSPVSETKHVVGSESDMTSLKGQTLTKPNANKLDACAQLDSMNESLGSSRIDKSASNESMSFEEEKYINCGTSCFSSDDLNSPGMQIVVGNDNYIPINDNGIRCPCGVNEDLGVMVECEKCSTWQHSHCINVATEDDAYEGYVCAFCLFPKDMQQSSLHQLKVDDKLRDKFELLESLRIQVTEGSVDANQVFNQVNLTLDEVKQAIQDVRRVANSLRVKWKLLSCANYEAELRIWQHAIWAPNQQGGINHSKTKYFLDCYKDNLKLNIINMMRELGRRCDLIKYQIHLAESRGDENHQKKNEKLLHATNEVEKVVCEFREKLNNLNLT